MVTNTVMSDNLDKLADVLNVPVVRVTYEVSGDQPLHPDPDVVSRMREIAISNDCGFGCKIYADPLSNVRVLAHNRNYGCRA